MGKKTAMNVDKDEFWEDKSSFSRFVRSLGKADKS